MLLLLLSTTVKVNVASVLAYILQINSEITVDATEAPVQITVSVAESAILVYCDFNKSPMFPPLS